MGKYSFIGDLVKDSSKAAKEVIENGGGSANQRAKMIKNCVNNVQSNLGKGQARAVSEMGGDSGKTLKEGIQTALDQTRARTAQKALNNHTSYQGNSAVQKSKEFIDKKRVNQVIDGHNAKQRDVEMQTIANNVKDRNINRVPKDHETARNAIDKANKAVRDGIKNTTKIENTVPIDTFKAGKAATYNVDNITKLDGTAPVINYNNNIKTMEIPDAPKMSKQEPKIEELLDTIEKQEKMIKDFQDGIEDGVKNLNADGNNNRAKERLNREFNDKFGSFKESAKDTFIGGISDSYKSIQDGQGIFEAIGNAHKNDDGSINWRRAAGTFMTASAAARVASGGGAYKDRYGNPNLIGVPFI